MAIASPFTQARNFISAVVSGVDPRTGLYTMNFTLASLLCNNTLGPQFPLSLNFSPMSSGNPFGLGIGITLGLTTFDDREGRGLLQLSSGEQYKTEWNQGELTLRQHKLDTIRLQVVDGEKEGGGKKIYVTWKTGVREVLEMVGGEGIYYPTRQETALGHAMTLIWDKAFRLSTVLDARGGRAVCFLEYPAEGLVKIHLLPTTPERAEVVLSQQNGYLTTIQKSCGTDTLVWTLGYDDEMDHRYADIRPLNKLTYPTGLQESVTYQGKVMQFVTDKGNGSLPAVVRFTRSPGAGQHAITRTYTYSDTNYMGFGAGIKTFDPDNDNLYDVLSAYDYWSKETLEGDGTSAVPAVMTERHYNNYHLLVSEKQTTAGSDLSVLRTTAYYALPGKQFIDQPVTFQHPRQQSVTWSDGEGKRTETTTMEYDAFGNLMRKTEPDGTLTEMEYYPSSGAGSDCPADPEGFTRFIKSRTVTPAKGIYDVPVYITRWYYKTFPVCQGSTLKGAVVQTLESRSSNRRQLSTRAYDYTSNPASYEHGRMSVLTDTVQGEDGSAYVSVQTFTFDTSTAGQLIQTVTTTADEEPGKKGSRKLTTTHKRTQSSLTGLLLTETDAAGNTAAYQWDTAGRLLSQVLHPDKKDYRATETFTYPLPNPDKHTPAATLHTDILGNQSRTDFDGLGRIITRAKQDPDGALGWQVMQSHRYDVQGRQYYSVLTDVLREQKDNNGTLQATLTRTWDNWGITSTEQDHELGVTAHRRVDPVGKVWPDKKGLGTLTTTESWTVSDTDGTVSPMTRQYYDSAHHPIVTEWFAVAKDGKSWEPTPYSQTRQIWDTAHRLRVATDVLGHNTVWAYDDLGRTTATTYADGSVVKRAYADFTTSALNTHISLVPPGGKEILLGERVFDGFGRGRSSTSGGRTSTLSYKADWQLQPSQISGPDGAQQLRVADPLLGEAPLSITASGNAADVAQTFDYERTTGRMTRAGEKDTATVLGAWKSGLLKSENVKIEGNDTPATQWNWSLGGLPEVYTGVDGATETRHWSAKGLLSAIIDPQVTVTLNYDNLNRLSGWQATETGGATIATVLGFDALSREASRTISYVSGEVKSTQTFTLSWNTANQLKQRILTQDGQPVRVESFSYDERNRLTDYRCGGSALPVDAYGHAFTRQTFSFDALGNSLTCETTLSMGGVDTATFHFKNSDDPCQLTDVTHSLTTHYPAQLSLKYDKAGRMIRDEEGRTLSYDALGRLHAITGSEYGYDARNRLVYQMVDSNSQAHRLYYRANRLVGEWINGKADSDGAAPDSKVRLVYAGGSCAAQATHSGDTDKVLLTGTDNKQSVVATAEDQTLTTTTYTPYGYTPLNKGDKMQNDPDSVTASSLFLLEFSDSTSSQAATIYSNGRNQVAVTVKTALLDKNANAVLLSAPQLWANLTLKTTRGDVIKKQAQDPHYAGLSVWNAPGDYTHAVRYDLTDDKAAGSDDDTSSVVVYLSTAELAGAYEIFAELNLKHYSETTEGGQGEGHFESHLKINTLPEIDYSSSELWTMKKQASSDHQTFSAHDVRETRRNADWYFFGQEYRLSVNGQHNEFSAFVETGDTFRHYTDKEQTDLNTSLYGARPFSAITSWPSEKGDNLNICGWSHMPWPLDAYGPNIGFQASSWAMKGMDDTPQIWNPVYATEDTHQIFDARTDHDYISVYRAVLYSTYDSTGLFQVSSWFPDKIKQSQIRVADVYGNQGLVKIGYKGGWDSPVFPVDENGSSPAKRLANMLVGTMRTAVDEPFRLVANAPDEQQSVQTTQENTVSWTVTKRAKGLNYGEWHSMVVFWNARGVLPEELPVPGTARKGDHLLTGDCFVAVMENDDTFIDNSPDVGHSITITQEDIANALKGVTAFTPQNVVLVGHIQGKLYGTSEMWHMGTEMQNHFSVWCLKDDGKWELSGAVTWDAKNKQFS
jgi:YD repeat-containing protein